MNPFDWLQQILAAASRVVPSPITDLLHWTLEGLGGLFGTVTNNVADAWHDFTAALDVVRAGLEDFVTPLLHQLEAIIEHWIPRYAITAWWWVTHPDQLAEQLLLYVVHWLEVRAWQIAPYLGKFVLALIVHNVRRIAQLAETILAAVL